MLPRTGARWNERVVLTGKDQRGDGDAAQQVKYIVGEEFPRGEQQVESTGAGSVPDERATEATTGVACEAGQTSGHADDRFLDKATGSGQDQPPNDSGMLGREIGRDVATHGMANDAGRTLVQALDTFR